MLTHQILRVYEESESLTIDVNAIAAFAGHIRADDLHLDRWDSSAMYQGPDETVVAWLLVANAIAFDLRSSAGLLPWCIEHGEEITGERDPFLGVLAALAQAAYAGLPIAEGDWLMELDEDALSNLLVPPPGHSPLSSMAKRLNAVREVGRLFRDVGSPMGVIEEGQQSVQGFVQALSRRCPSWEDSRVIRGQRIRFLERAGRCAAMLYGRFGGEGPGRFTDIAELRIGADRRIPQFLIAHNIVRLFDGAWPTRHIPGGILEGSGMEVELRAASLHAIELLRCELLPRFPGLIPLQVSSHLWKASLGIEPVEPALQGVVTQSY